MKAPLLSLSWQQIYHWLFVIILTGLLLLGMVMSIRQGLEGFEDHFYQQNVLIENFNRLRLKLGDRVFLSVLVGKDGWMDYTAENNLDDYQNAVNFSPEALQLAARRIQACNQYAQENNITFLIVVAPNKASIYPDKLPEEIQPLSGLSRVDQLNDYLRAHHIPEVLDLRPALRDARREHEVFYKLGTHWNEYGAYVAYKTIIQALSQHHPDLQPYPAEFFRFRSVAEFKDSRRDRALAKLIQANYIPPEPTLFATRDLDEFVHEQNFGNEDFNFHKISWLPESNLASLLLYHDSFANFGLSRFLALNFSWASYIHRGSAHLYLNRKTIEEFSPEVVIYEVAERYLYLLPADLSGCATN
jgi:hypothetical protein